MIKTLNKNNGVAILELSNDDMIVTVSNYGCTILGLKVKNKNNEWQDTVIGFKTIEDYMVKDGSYLGAIVGRVANRIENGKFKIKDKIYQLDLNNGPNSLHGGYDGFSYQTFDYEVSDNSILFHYFSKDGDQKFPGNLELFVTYKIDKANLAMEYQAMCDQDTVINITNHCYFNLNTSGVIDDHQLSICSDNIGLNDENHILKGNIVDIRNTDLDLNEYKSLKDVFQSDHPAIKQSKGLGNSFILKGNTDQIKLYSPTSGIELSIETTYPSVQVYTANNLNIKKDKYGNEVGCHGAIALETEYLINSMNWEENSPTYLYKGNLFYEKTILKFKVK